MRWGQLFLAGIALCFLNTFASARIVIDYANFTATSQDRSLRSTPITFPLSTSLDVTGPNGYSNNSINWFLNGSQTVISFDMQHGQAGSEQLARFKSLEVYFTATSDDPFAFSGYYDINQVGTRGGAEAMVSFYDTTANLLSLFENTQIVTLKPGSTHLSIPGTSGVSPHLNGSPIGDVISGHDYVLIFDFEIEGTSTTSSPSSAVGNLTLTIGNVPEPTSAGLIAFAEMLLGTSRRRRAV